MEVIFSRTFRLSKVLRTWLMFVRGTLGFSYTALGWPFRWVIIPRMLLLWCVGRQCMSYWIIVTWWIFIILRWMRRIFIHFVIFTGVVRVFRRSVIFITREVGSIIKSWGISSLRLTAFSIMRTIFSFLPIALIVRISRRKDRLACIWWRRIRRAFVFLFSRKRTDRFLSPRGRRWRRSTQEALGIMPRRAIDNTVANNISEKIVDRNNINLYLI